MASSRTILCRQEPRFGCQGREDERRIGVSRRRIPAEACSETVNRALGCGNPGWACPSQGSVCLSQACVCRFRAPAGKNLRPPRPFRSGPFSVFARRFFALLRPAPAVFSPARTKGWRPGTARGPCRSICAHIRADSAVFSRKLCIFAATFFNRESK